MNKRSIARGFAVRRHRAGTCVAISLIEMRMIEAITIYLAAGAPFGVSYYLRREHGGGRAAAVVRGSWAALLWPVAAASVALARTRKSAEAAGEETALHARAEENVERARRQLLAMLYRIEELARSLPARESQGSERVACVVRESVERYVGLTLGARDVSADAPPTGREMELCRIAGRTGDDLLLAGRCIHRRNVARLVAHRERARTDLLHALAEVRDLCGDASANGDIIAARHASVLILRFYGQAINLLSLLEDEDAARKVARLLDAECARLRRLEATSPGRSHEEEHPSGEEQCTPHTHRLAFTGPSPTSPLTRG